MSAFNTAVRVFEQQQDRYDEFGASDTEPRTEFTLLLERIADGKDPQVPVTIRQWQLFSTMKSGEAARALTRTAREVVKAAKTDRAGFVEYMEYNYGIEVF